MYQIRCDDYVLYDPREEALQVLDPKCKLKVNTVGEASFTILPNHPSYTKLQRLRSVFEFRQDDDVIFRGRMVDGRLDFLNRLSVDLEGVLGYANDTLVPPFAFPDDFPAAATASNVVAYFLGWILEQHNGQVQPWQQLKLGRVTVSDPNNYITRASEKYASTWDTLKSKLFDSSLGGYLAVRYEANGNYVDYLDSFELTNTQRVALGQNLLDLTQQSDAAQTYSAILPLGAEVEDESGEKYTLTLASLPDGPVSDDLVKSGLYLYSTAAVAQYGWICVPIQDATWADVTEAQNLKTKAMAYLAGTAIKVSETIAIKAVDLRFTDDQIQSFRFCRNVLVDSSAHDVSTASYPLTELSIDLLNPQNTLITLGDTRRTLADVNQGHWSDTQGRLDNAEQDIHETKGEITEVKNQITLQQTQILTSCESIILSALQNYVETSNYEEFRQTVQSQLEIMADQIAMTFSTTTEHIDDVNGDLQAKFSELYKYISFSEDGITIGGNESGITLNLDNDGISFSKNGVAFGRWDGNDFYTGNIVVEVNERAQFGNFAFIPRSDGSLSFLKVGG
jgi:hypothetical protein